MIASSQLKYLEKFDRLYDCARAVAVVFEDGKAIDTIVHVLDNLIGPSLNHFIVMYRIPYIIIHKYIFCYFYNKMNYIPDLNTTK